MILTQKVSCHATTSVCLGNVRMLTRQELWVSILARVCFLKQVSTNCPRVRKPRPRASISRKICFALALATCRASSRESAEAAAGVTTWRMARAISVTSSGSITPLLSMSNRRKAQASFSSSLPLVITCKASMYSRKSTTPSRLQSKVRKTWRQKSSAQWCGKNTEYLE